MQLALGVLNAAATGGWYSGICSPKGPVFLATRDRWLL